jgi:hypothetical protein
MVKRTGTRDLNIQKVRLALQPQVGAARAMRGGPTPYDTVGYRQGSSSGYYRFAHPAQ